MISVRSTTPPPSNYRPGLSLATSSFSDPVSPNSSYSLPPDSSQQSLPGLSTPSPPPLDPDVSSHRFPHDIAEPVPPPMSDVPLEIYADDEGLSPVEKIYLFCRSKSAIHRVFISRSLHTFLTGVSPLEAVEYVLPLLIGLAVDDEDAVKEALITNLVTIMWWFFENCQLTEDEPPDQQEDPPLLPVQTFTPILGSLLIDHNAMVGGPARFAVVEILNRLRTADDTGQDQPPFGSKERKMLEQEIIHQVIIGMGRLDVSEENFPSPVSKPELTPVLSSTVSSPPRSGDSPPILEPPLPQLSSSLVSQVATSNSPPPTVAPPFSPPIPPLSLEAISLSPDYSSSRERQSLVSLPPAAHPCIEASVENRMSFNPHSNQATLDDSTVNEGFTNEHDGWLVAEGQYSQETQEDVNEQAAIGRLSSMSLIATVTAHAKLPEDTIRAFVDEVSYIGGDPLYWVRREASFAVGALAKVVPTEVVLLSLLPLFEALARDSVWHVRHSAVFALPGILGRLTPQHRRILALKTLLPLAEDIAPTVRSGVLEVLGEVIYTFHEDEGGAPEEIVNLFIGPEEERRQHGEDTEHRFVDSMIAGMETSSGKLSSVFENDDESLEVTKPDVASSPGPTSAVIDTHGGLFRNPARPLITSFNYPAVALSLGPQRWAEVRDYYLSLTRDANLRVRRTIAAGLGEMARILGSELTERDLMDVWQDMVHDVEDGQTRLKTLGGICLFVGALEGPSRESVVSTLVELWERWLTGWRERECLTRALPTLAELVGGQGGVIRTLLGKALVDNVAAVREAAIGALSYVLRAFESRPHLAEALREDLQGLACADLCRRRATYISCYRALADGENGQVEVTRDEFWKHIVHLSEDNVVDVRIGVARLLGVVCEKFYPKPSSRTPRIIEIIRRLSQDTSRDVRAFVAYLLVPVDITQFRTSPPLSTTPTVAFATFSCPPPQTLPSLVSMEGQSSEAAEGTILERAVQEDETLDFATTIPERETDHPERGTSQAEENKERGQGGVESTDGSFKPPPLQRRRSDNSTEFC